MSHKWLFVEKKVSFKALVNNRAISVAKIDSSKNMQNMHNLKHPHNVVTENSCETFSNPGELPYFGRIPESKFMSYFKPYNWHLESIIPILADEDNMMSIRLLGVLQKDKNFDSGIRLQPRSYPGDLL
ncbi:hypothetical protein PV328_007795 [Microctonus aethiopoides]|uniref:Uncharacterized protein n=1 Tax=Microctonus aethiopoides TaxID=144406 RepID=A0AA39F0T7_9HYME|nr:hypothetical protein PV328_007795 [Microctonus aethiopoides]